MHILLINGPNLNLLGRREPDVYGSQTLEDIENDLIAHSKTLGVALDAFQSNAEHELINRIHEAQGAVSGIVINPGAFTHTSVALRDALLGVEIPFIEVHISNVHKRESFRHHSYFSDIAVGTIVGLGTKGYQYALDALVAKLNTH
jgi:3-dehydroquinate dehydratase-2